MVTYFLFGYLMNSIFSTNDSQLRVRSYFYEIPYSLIFLPKTLIRNKISFPASNSLNFAELMENKHMKSISKRN